MILEKAISVLNEGLIFGLFAVGVYVAFIWLRFPDLTPDGSFLLGGSVYVKSVHSNIPPFFALCLAGLAGALAGSCTAAVNRFAKVPTVVAGLLIALGLYSAAWLFLGSPNVFLPSKLTIVGEASSDNDSIYLLIWIFAISVILLVQLSFFANSIWGLRARAVGENPFLALDLGISETWYTFLLLMIANALVGLSGGLFVQRSYSVDIGMGIGQTLIGLIGMMLGLLISRNYRSHYVVILSIMFGTVVYKASVFVILEAGLPPESFRLISSLSLILIFVLVESSGEDLLRGIKWS